MSRPVIPLFKGRRRGIILRLIANGMGQAIAGFGVALILRRIFDIEFAVPLQAESSAVGFWGGLLLAAVIAGAWLKWWEQIDAERLGQDYVREIRARLFAHLSRVPAYELKKRRQGGVLLRFVGDMYAVRQWASFGIARLWVGSVMTLAVLLGLAYLHVWFSLVIMVLLAAGIAAVWLCSEPLSRRVRYARKAQGVLAASINEMLQYMSVIQVFGQRHNESRRIDRIARRLQSTLVERAKVGGLLRAIAVLMVGLFGIALVLVGLWLRPGVSQGTVLAALSLVSLLALPLLRLTRVVELWPSARQSQEKLAQLFALESSLKNVPAAKKSRARDARLHVHAVQVSREFPEFSAVAEAGERVVLTGDVGAASALMRMIARLEIPVRGRILIGGRAIDAVTIGSLRRAVSMVSAELPLLRGSLDFNLRYRKPEAAAAEIEYVVELCGLGALRERLPEGFAADLRQASSYFRDGDRQRLLLARALLGNPLILLLDYAETKFDPATERVVRDALAEFKGTILLSAPEASKLMTVDAIWSFGIGGKLSGRAREAIL